MKFKSGKEPQALHKNWLVEWNGSFFTFLYRGGRWLGQRELIWDREQRGRQAKPSQSACPRQRTGSACHTWVIEFLRESVKKIKMEREVHGVGLTLEHTLQFCLHSGDEQGRQHQCIFQRMSKRETKMIFSFQLALIQHAKFFYLLFPNCISQIENN